MESNIAIIILNYNDYNLTEENVDNLINLKIEYPIVIVDNNSPNNSFQSLFQKYKNFNNIYVIKNLENKGYASGNNFGVKFILKKLNYIKYICIMNPDAMISYKDIFSNLTNKIGNREDIALIGSMMIYNNIFDSKNTCWKLPNNRSVVTGYFNFLSRFRSRNGKERLIIDKVDSSLAKVDVVPGSFFIIKRDALEEIGLFDENTFLYNEENVLAIKLRDKDYSECLSINDYYFHNHKKLNRKRNLEEKININKINYQSRKYLCKTFYHKKLVFFLDILYFINILDISFFHFMSKFKRV